MQTPPLSLKLRVFRAGSWVLFGHVAAQLVRLVGNLVLTRLLVPEVFGIMSIAMTVQAIVALSADFGIRQCVIQSQNGADPRYLNTAWTLEIIRCLYICGACVAVAIALYGAGRLEWLPRESVYASPVLPPVIAATSLMVVIEAFQSMNAIVAHRVLDLHRLTIIELLSQIVGLLVMGVLAWNFGSVWCFVVGTLISTACKTSLTHLWLHGPRSRFAWDRTTIQELIHFGRWIWLSSAVGVFAANGDRLLLGAWVDASFLGFYSIAITLATAIDSLAFRLFSSVCLPALSEVARSRPDRLPALYFRMRWAADVIFVGLAGFLFAFGQDIINIMYDTRYAQAGWMLEWLSFSLLFSRYGLTQNCYLALGRPNYCSAISICNTLSIFILVPSLYYAFGIQGAIVGIACRMAPATLVILFINQKLRLNNVLLELSTLCVWPLGWSLGFGFSWLFSLG